MPTPPKRMTQKEFADKLKLQAPELKDFNDNQIVSKVLELRPDLMDKIENPMAGDADASNAQMKAERASHSMMDPAVWDNHPNLRRFTDSALNTLPAGGAVLGGLATGPETGGLGALAGAPLGAGIGRGLSDIARQALGLGNTSTMDRAANIGMDTGLTAIMPGLATIARAPIQSARIGAGMFSNLENEILPPWVNRLTKIPAIEDFANSGGNKFDPLVRPAGNNIPIRPDKIKFTYQNGQLINKETGEVFDLSKQLAKESADKTVNDAAKLRGTVGDVPDNDVARKLEQERNALSSGGNNLHPIFNPRNQRGMTGSQSNIEDVIKHLLGPAD